MYPLQRFVSYFFSSLSHFWIIYTSDSHMSEFWTRKLFWKGKRRLWREKPMCNGSPDLYSPKCGHILLRRHTFQLFSNFSNKARCQTGKDKLSQPLTLCFMTGHTSLCSAGHSLNRHLLSTHYVPALGSVVATVNKAENLQRLHPSVKQTKYRCKWNVEWLGQC